MTPNDIIVEAKRLAQDNELFRNSDTYSAATMLGFVNQILRQTSVLRPDLFTRIADIATTPNVVEQSMPTDSIRLVNILGVKNGGAITEVSREMLDRSYPQWRTDPAGPPINYMRHVVNPNRYFLYPRPAANTVLTGEYAQSPPAYTLNQTIALLPDAFQAAMVAGVVMLIAGIENKSQVNARFTQFQEVYSQTLGVNLQSRTITDTRAAGIEPNQVI
jgi:hypothetical protein